MMNHHYRGLSAFYGPGKSAGRLWKPSSQAIASLRASKVALRAYLAHQWSAANRATPLVQVSWLGIGEIPLLGDVLGYGV